MLRGIDRWGLGYLKSVLRRERFVGKRHLLVCVADHFEPFDKTILPDGSITGGVSDAVARGFVREWCSDYRKVLGEFRDADGVAPRHTFFYPWDEYDAGCLDELSSFCRDGFGEVEIHLHHRNDSEEGVRQKLVACRDTFAGQHGLLGRSLVREKSLVSGQETCVRGGKINVSQPLTNDPRPITNDQRPMTNDDEPAYSFVHGNWCLCNGRADGDWCGVERELAILAETGCYADLTFPSAPSDTQTRSVNEIYYGRDPEDGERGVQREGRLGTGYPSCLECVDTHTRPARDDLPLSFESRGNGAGSLKLAVRGEGTPAPERGRERESGGVVMIPGPLGLNWGRRKFEVLPGLENGETSGVNPATIERLRLWSKIGVHVRGRPEWVVIKLHTHGAVHGNRDALLGEQMVSFHRELTEVCGDESELCLHYVSARELFNIIKAAEGGFGGNPGQYRNHKIRPGF